MTNAREEFLFEVKRAGGIENLLCATISFGMQYGDDDDPEDINLKIGFTEEDLEIFLAKLDREYDSGYGSQELFGTIWYKDGTWSDRKEYDGAEDWVHLYRPVIPIELHASFDVETDLPLLEEK